MRSRFLAVVALLLSACASGEAGMPGHSAEHVHPDVTSLGRPDRAIAGPQGAVPQFLVECDYSHMAEDDPIVYPGAPGASHLHVFFGNTSTNANSTVKSLAQIGRAHV